MAVLEASAGVVVATATENTHAATMKTTSAGLQVIITEVAEDLALPRMTATIDLVKADQNVMNQIKSGTESGESMDESENVPQAHENVLEARHLNLS